MRNIHVDGILLRSMLRIMDKNSLITFRPAAETDKSFIFRTVLLGTYHGNRYGKNPPHDVKAPIDFFSSIDQDTFMKGYHAHVETLLSRPQVFVRIACLVADPDVILGFSIIEQDKLHYVFVKPQWRKIGLAKDLVDLPITTVTGFTRVGDILRRKYGWKFNPWA